MIARILRILGLRRARRATTHLTPAYEKRRIRELQKARAKFEVAR